MTAVQQWWGLPVPGALRVLWEDFETGLGSWTTELGGGFFSTQTTSYGLSLYAQAVNSSGASDRRSKVYLPSGTQADHFRVRGMLTGYGNDDAPTIVVRNLLGGTSFYVGLGREVTYDASQRPQLALGTDNLYAGSDMLTLNVWYWFDIYVVPGAGNSTWAITRCADDVVWASGTFPSDHGSSKEISSVAIYAESTASFTSKAGYFDDLSCYIG